MSLTVRIVWQYILSRVRVSVRLAFFYPRKTLKISRMPTLGHVAVEWTSGTGNSHGWMASDVGAAATTAVYLVATDWAKTAKIDKPKRRQWEFIPSRLEKCGLGIITCPMRLYSACKNQQWRIVCLMLSRLKIQIILVLDRLRCGPTNNLLWKVFEKAWQMSKKSSHGNWKYS